MPKFYFQLTDGLTKVADTAGCELADAAAARQHASQSAKAFSRRAAQFNGNEGLYWQVRVVDETGSQVFTLQLGRPGSLRRGSKS